LFVMLTGRIAKAEGVYWLAECEALGAFTQGRSRKDAYAMLADCIETKVSRKGFKVTVTETAQLGEHDFAVFVDADEPALLIAEVLKYQRERQRMTQHEVVARLGYKHQNAYAAYERGEREPSLGKLRELLAVVAPDLALQVGPRTSDNSNR
jgi:Helix-turn-helix